MLYEGASELYWAIPLANQGSSHNFTYKFKGVNPTVPVYADVIYGAG